jgi:hypothetical protein
MRLGEQHRIDRHDVRFAAIDAAAIDAAAIDAAAIDAAAFASKHRYNPALYATRLAFIHQSRVITYEELARDMKASVEYRALPAKVAQWALRQVALAWTS